MNAKGKNEPFRGLVNPPSGDQHFLLNFIMSTFLGPDVYSDNPRCSAAHRLAKGLPPYASNNLGDSFLRVSQLQGLYYYVLRNAHPSLVLNPKMLCLYLEGKLALLGSGEPEDCEQFTSFFPLSVHGRRTYTPSHEIVKGIVLIKNPDTSYLKREVLERFRFLSGMDSLKIDIKKCLSYENPSGQKGGEETEQRLVSSSDEETVGTISSRNETPPVLFQQTYKKHDLPVPAFHCGGSFSKGHNEDGSTLGRSCNLDGSGAMPCVAFPKFEDYYTTDESVILTGTARRLLSGPPIGLVDIGVSENAYLFQVALPGVRSDSGEFSCEIESDGKVHIQGSMSGGKIIKEGSRVFHIKSQQLCPPGPFTVSFNLPGPVDPRLFSPNFRDDGIFEGVIIKQNKSKMG